MNDTPTPQTPIEGEIIDRQETDSDVRNAVQEARALIPAGPTGVTPSNFAQMVDFAKTMTLARNAIPRHLQNAPGDCLAVIDISAKVGLSPYMVANKTYVQNNRLCFESQLFHAFAQASGLLRGDLSVAYEGEGEDMVCIVRGFLRGDPEEKIHRSPPLKEVRPKRNQDGVVKGSPLWDRKPRVQLFYDTSRDWVRIFAPRATLGIYTPEEMQEYDIAPDAPTENGAALKDRLSGADRSEGHKPGHVDAELANVASNSAHPPEKGPPKKTKAKKEKATKDKPGDAPKPDPTPDQLPDQKTAQPEEFTVPQTAGQYVVYADSWIEQEPDKDNAEARWDGEYEMRVALSVPVKDRNALRERIDQKFGIIP